MNSIRHTHCTTASVMQKETGSKVRPKNLERRKSRDVIFKRDSGGEVAVWGS